jgi:hypothetical protein
MYRRAGRPRFGCGRTLIIITLTIILVLCGIYLLISGAGINNGNVGRLPENPTSPPFSESPYFTLYATKVTYPSPTHPPTSSPISYRPVTWMELVSFIETDHTNWNEYDPDYYVCLDFAIDLVENARKQNIKAWVVGVEFYNDDIGHAFTGFETTDRGIVFIEPQTDIPYTNPAIGKLLCDAWEGTNCVGEIKSIEYYQCDHSHFCSPYTP